MRDLRKSAVIESINVGLHRLRPFILIMENGWHRYWIEVARDEQHAMEMAKSIRTPLENQTMDRMAELEQDCVQMKGLSGNLLILKCHCKQNPRPEIGLLGELEDGRILFVSL